MEIDCEESFKAWLVKELEPVCDCDPMALAKYVVALVQKPGKTDDALRDHINSQLEAFLHSHTKRFSEKLLNVLKNKAYIPKKDSPEVKHKKETTPEKEKKEELNKPKERDDAKPTTSSGSDRDDRRRTNSLTRKDDKKESSRSDRLERKRISPPPSEAKKESREREQRDLQRRKSRSPRDRRGRRRSPEYSRSRHNRRSRSRSNERRERKDDIKIKRKCRDYHENGLCQKGDTCQYDHGPDHLVFEDTGLAAPNFSVPPPGFNALNPPPPGVDGGYVPAPVEGYNPEASAISGPNFSVPPPPIPIHMNTAGGWRTAPYAVPHQGGIVPMPYDPSVSLDAGGSGPMRSLRGRVRGGPENMANKPNRGDNKTIQVKKIPPEQNKIAKLNDHFTKFGNIVNIQVNFNSDPTSALITFSTHQEAVCAIKSTEPIFNNRFIRVYWYNPDNIENCQTGSQMAANGQPHRIEKSTPPVVNQPPPKVATVREAKFVNPAVLENRQILADIRKALKEKKTRRDTVILLQKKSLMLREKLVDKQKNVLTTLREIKETEKKKKLKEIAKKFSDHIKNVTADMEKYMEELKNVGSQIQELEEQLITRAAGNDDSRNSESPPLKEEGTVTVVTTKNLLKEGENADQWMETKSVILVKGFEKEDKECVIEQLNLAGDFLDVKQDASSSGEPELYVTYKTREDAEMAIITGITVRDIPLSMTALGDDAMNTLLQGIGQNDSDDD